MKCTKTVYDRRLLVKELDEARILPAKWTEVFYGFTDGDHTEIAKDCLRDMFNDNKPLMAMARKEYLRRFSELIELCQAWAEDMEKIGNPYTYEAYIGNDNKVHFVLDEPAKTMINNIPKRKNED